nr:reverse transcriptase domain-containing protein [Tanacetum cinerariifolium]
MPVELGSFDVIIGMDWLRRCHTVIVCDEKLVRVPYGNETLIFHGDESIDGRESRLTIISCSNAQEYMAKGCQIFLAQISAKKEEDKSEGKGIHMDPAKIESIKDWASPKTLTEIYQFQVNTMFLNTLPPKWSKFVTNVKLSQQYSSTQSSKHLSITYESNDYQSSVYYNAYSPPSSIPHIEYAPTVNQQQQPEFSSLYLAVVTSRYTTTNNQLQNSSNPRTYTPGTSESNSGKKGLLFVTTSVEIDHLKQTLLEYLKEKESLMKTVTLLKNDFKKEDDRVILSTSMDIKKKKRFERGEKLEKRL